MPASVLVVDDDADFRWLLITLLEADPCVHIAGEAADGETSVDRVRQEAPRIVLMDLMMPRRDGLEATRQIKREAPETTVIVLSALPGEPYRSMARDSGADVFLNKQGHSGDAIADYPRSLGSGIVNTWCRRSREQYAQHLSTVRYEVLLQ
jgi:DNA-binding NarL/FixJ family response regulator